MGDDELQAIENKYKNSNGQFDFDAFMAMMQDRATDKDTEDAILESWKVIAGDKTFVTKQDMGMAGMDPEHIEYLCANMPQAEGLGRVRLRRMDQAELRLIERSSSVF